MLSLILTIAIAIGIAAPLIGIVAMSHQSNVRIYR